MVKNKSKKIGSSILSFLLTLSLIAPSVSNVTLAAQSTDGIDSQSSGATYNSTWDFSDSAQASDFTLHQSATSAFSIVDGTLKADGTDGEMKAMLNTSFASGSLKQVSVDIIPNSKTSSINAGMYLGASDATNEIDGVNALAFLVESNNTEDANRIDVVTGKFEKDTDQPWLEIKRKSFRADSSNALYSSGNKLPLNLKLDFDDDNITVTLSLRDDASKYYQTVYYCDPSTILGQIGLRANYSDVAFDNLKVEYEGTSEAGLREGLDFTGANAPLVQTDSAISQIPNTIEMWVKMNPRVTGGRTTYRQPLISSINPSGASASTAGDFALFTGMNGNLWWYETTDTTVSDTTSAEAYEWTRLSTENHWNGEWMHVALSRAEGTVILYINGEKITTISNDLYGDAATPTQPISFGYSELCTSPTQNNLDGSIGDVRLWSTTRTQEEIQADMHKSIKGTETGLMHYWKFDEQSGTTFKDSVANGINGTISETISLSKGNGLEFTGTNEAVVTTNKAVSHIPQAIELWVKIDTDSKADQETLIAAYSGQNQAAAISGDWYLGTAGNGTLRWVEKNANGQSGQMNGSTNIQTGEWTHIAVVRSEGDIKFYINGVEDTITKASTVSRITLDTTKTASTTVPTLGYCVYNTISYTNYLDGALRDVRLWNVDRTQANIQADMNQTLNGTEEGLMHYWKLNEVSGTTFTDSAADNNGTIQGTTTNWIVEEGMQFPGINAPLAMAEKPVDTIPRTVEMWVQIDSASQAKHHALVSAYDAKTQSAGSGDWQLDVTGGVLRWVDMTSKGKSGQLKAATKLATGEWVHVAVTRENGFVKFYINGTLDKTVTYSTYEDSTASYTIPTFGYSIFDSATGASYLDGALKDVRIWNVTRTADEIAANMNQTLIGTEEGLMNYWKMDENAGVQFKDSTSSENHGTTTVYWSNSVAKEEETVYTNDGFNFENGDKWQTKDMAKKAARSVEAWVKVPTATGDSSRLTIVSGHPESSFHMDIYTNGKPRLYYRNANGVTVNYVANVDVRTNKWTHIAWTCDDTTGIVTCYINGEAVYTNNTIGDPVIVNHLYVGRDNRSGWQYPFVGQLADVRVWEKTLTAAEVKHSMNTVSLNQPEGLFLDVPLDVQSEDAELGKTFEDKSVNNNTLWIWRHALTWMTREEVDAKLDAEYAEQGIERKETEYSIAVIPDQQNLTQYHCENNTYGRPDKLTPMYEWIEDQIESQNVQMVINVGDIVNTYSNINHWNAAKAVYDNSIAGKVPYIYALGNHDYHQTEFRVIENTENYFPLSMFEEMKTRDGKSTFGGSYSGDVSNTWQQFEVNGHKYLVLALEFGPRDSVLEWANEVVAAHPDHQVIVVTHGYMNYDGTWLDGYDPSVPTDYAFLSADGQEKPNNADAVWDKFVKNHENIIMVFSGHISSDNIIMRTDTGVHGNEVKQFLVDSQILDRNYVAENEDGKALVAMLNFSNDGQNVELTYYSTAEKAYMNPDSQFLFNLPSKKAEATDKFTGMTLNLDGTISFNFYVSKGHSLSDDAYVEFDVPKSGTQKVALKDAVETNNGLKFTCSVPAKEMADVVTATIYDGGKIIDTKAVSVRDYAEIIIKNEANLETYTKATPLMKSMLHYGTYAQKLFDYNTDNLANKNYVSEDMVQNVTVEDLAAHGKPYQGLDGFGGLAGATLILKSETTLRMFFSFESNVDLEGLKFTVNGKEQEYKQSGNFYIVECTNIAAKDLDLEYEVAVMLNETTKFTATCSAMTFCHSAIYNSSTSDALRQTAKALYLYNVQANRYMEGEVVKVSEDYEAVSGMMSSGVTRGFTVQDGKLVPLGATGEGKVMASKMSGTCKSVSVDIYPGNIINSGIYIGASNAADAQDSINGLVIMLESAFSGWDDAANRIDIVVGNFPAWAEYHRVVSETGNGNALFTNGEKKPLNLKVDIEGNVITITLSLVSDPSKSVTTTYTYNGAYDLANGQVGIRSQYDNSSFDNFKVETTDATKTYTFENEDVSGLEFYHSTWDGGVTALAANTLALHKTAKFVEGTLSAELNTNGNNEAGIVFGADAKAKNYYLYRLTADRFVELVKVENGKETVLDRGYLSAGHQNTAFNRLEVVKEGNSIYCYYYNRFDKINCYAVCEDEEPLSGTYVGLWSEKAGTVFQNMTSTNAAEVRKADVLIFGHSYTEMWWDFETYFPEYTSIDDIGIGGSVAVHWESLTDEVINYEPNLGIYNIGINDLTGGTTPKAVVQSMEKALLEIKSALPEFKAVVVSVSHCPARSTITAQISETNALMRNLAASYDWISYAETEYLFCTDKSDPLSTNASLFIDGLHPSAEGYQLMAECIRSAIKGENQPAFDEALAQKYMNEAKSNILASLGIYSEAAYTAENWAEAKPYYDAAVAKINACTTEEQLKALDLSAEKNALNAIPNKSVNVVANLLNAENRIALGADAWTKTNDNTINVNGYSYVLDKTATYSDMEAVFSVTNNTGDVATGGLFLRASAYANNGIKGYLINYVSSGNYMQVYYVDNCYNTDGSAYTLQYIGGIAYGTYGDIIGTEFHVKVEGDKLYLSTLERYQAGKDPLTVVDLTYNGTYEVIAEGYFGELAWNNNVSYDLTLKHFSGEAK